MLFSETASGCNRLTATVLTTHRLINNYSRASPLTISATPSGSTTETAIVKTSHRSSYRSLINYSSTNVVHTTRICPPNMVHMNCTCQGTCQDPTGCHVNCSGIKTCVCPYGFLMKGDASVTAEECECFIEGYRVLKVGWVIKIKSYMENT